MLPRVSLDTSSRASRQIIDSDHHHQQTGGAAAPNSFTSALDVPPQRPTALRRRGSDGDCPRYRASSSHHAKYPSMDSASPTDPHPLRRANTTARSARYDTGSTRPRLSRALSPKPNTPTVLARPPSPTGFPPQAESHRTVLAHEVPLMPFFYLLLLGRKKHCLTLHYLPRRSRRMTRSRASP